MGTLIAYCGLDCEACPIHLATLEQDRLKQHAMRVDIARLCSEYYGMDVLPQEVTDAFRSQGDCFQDVLDALSETVQLARSLQVALVVPSIPARTSRHISKPTLTLGHVSKQ